MRRARLTVALTAILSGCAAQDLQLDDAAKVSRQGDIVSASGSAYVAELQSRRRAALVAIVASDTSCTWNSRGIWLRPAWKVGETLCVNPRTATGAQEVSLRVIQAEALAPTLKSISALAAYDRALAAIVGEKAPDIAGSIDKAISAAQEANTAIGKIAGGAPLNLSVLKSAQATAAKQLLDTLVKLEVTREKADKLRKIAAKADISQVFPALRTSIQALNTLQDQNSALMLRTALGNVYGREAFRWNFDERRQVIADIAAAQDDLDKPAMRTQALLSAIDGLETVNTKLTDALAGRFTKSERQSIASHNLREIGSILANVAAFIPVL